MKNPYNIFLYILYGLLFLLSISFLILMIMGRSVDAIFDMFETFNYMIIFLYSLACIISITKLITDVWKK